MSAIVFTILPVFGLIALGFIAARSGYVSAAASQGIAQFVFNLALPALLFRTVATMTGDSAKPWNLWLGLFGGIAAGWLITTFAGRRLALGSDGAAALAMGASFGNIAMLGLPLAISHFGPAAALPVSLILSVHAPVLWLAATLHMEIERHGQIPSAWTLARQLFLEFARNPIVIALVGGSLWHWSGFALHPVPDRMLDLLGSAGVPSALVALGLSLATYSLKGQWGGIALLIGVKMLVIPAAVWLLLTYVAPVPLLWKQVAMMLAVMPTGANAYLFAQRYDQNAAAVSGAIAIGTGIAIFTTAALLWLMEQAMI